MTARRQERILASGEAGSGAVAALAALAVVALGCWALWTWLRPETAQPAQAPVGESPAAADETPAAPALAQGEAKGPPPTPSPELPLLLPDGTRVANLNGVAESVEFPWPGNHAYAPIVSVIHEPDGTDWYLHDDGTRTTTLYRKVNGVMRPLGLSATPTTPVPLSPSLLDKMYADGQLGGKPAGR